MSYLIPHKVTMPEPGDFLPFTVCEWNCAGMKVSLKYDEDGYLTSDNSSVECSITELAYLLGIPLRLPIAVSVGEVSEAV